MPANPSEFVQTRVPVDIWDRIKRHADRAGLSATQIANRLLVEMLDAIESGEAPEIPPLAVYLRTLDKTGERAAQAPQGIASVGAKTSRKKAKG
jgi:hypothetical protein